MGKYTDQQRLSKVWIWLLSLVSIGNFFVMLNVLEKHLTIGIIGIAIPFLVLAVLYILKLNVTVDEEKITYRLFPFHLSEKEIYRKDIERLEIRKYDALSEFGGWGIRYSLKNGKAYIISGDVGLQIYFKDGRKMLLGIAKPSELKNII